MRKSAAVAARLAMKAGRVEIPGIRNGTSG